MFTCLARIKEMADSCDSPWISNCTRVKSLSSAPSSSSLPTPTVRTRRTAVRTGAADPGVGWGLAIGLSDGA